MFGVLKPEGKGWTCGQRREWAGHYCGTCLALGDSFGQTARLATSYDAALISALTEAQSREPLQRMSHVCPLRGFRTLDVVAPTASGARYAASLSTLMVATKLDDHAQDGDGLVGRLPALARALARRLRRATRQVSQGLGFDTRTVEDAVAEQGGRESEPGRDFLFYSEPTERSSAAAFAHTAELAGRPENRGLLEEMGALYGRLIFLIDSVRDLDGDRRRGHFNALDASKSGPAAGERQTARRLFAQAHERLAVLVGELKLDRPDLVRHLLVEQLGSLGTQLFETREERDERRRIEKTYGKKETRSSCCDGCCDVCSFCECCASSPSRGCSCCCDDVCCGAEAGAAGCCCCDGCCSC